MPKSKVKIVVDTNLWISFLISDRLEDFGLALKHYNVVLLLSENLVKEVLSTALRPKFRGLITESGLRSLRDLFKNFGEVISTQTIYEICRDPRDIFLLELAVDGAADYLLSGDQDLLVLMEVEGVPIVKYTHWVAQMHKLE